MEPDHPFVAAIAYLIYRPCFAVTGNDMMELDDLEAVVDLWHQPASPPYDNDGDGIATVVDIISVSSNLGQVCN